MTKNRGSLRACDVVLRVAGVLVPRHRRADWLREWRAELWHEAAHLEKEGLGRVDAAVQVVRRSLGALPDAVAVRRFHPAPAQEDVFSAFSVVFRSPGAAGAAMLMVALAAAVDTVTVMVSRFVTFMPEEYRAIMLTLTAALVVLLALASCIAAAVAVAWSDAARREEAIRRAMGIPDGRLRRQRALEGVLIALVGSGLGIYIAAGLTERTYVMLQHNGYVEAAARLEGGPGVGVVGTAMAIVLSSLLAITASLRRKRPALE